MSLRTRNPPYNFGEWTIKPVYDISYYGYDIPIHFLDPSLTLTSVTNSATTFAQANATNIPVTNYDLILSNTDSMPLANVANNTDLNLSEIITPDMTALIFEAHVNIAFGMNVSAWTSGTVTFTSVQIIMTYLDTGEVLYDTGVVNTGITGLGATGSQLFLLNSDVNFKPSIRGISGRSIKVNLKTVSSSTGTATRQMGIYPNFSFHKQLSPAVPIYYTPSRILLHLHPTFDHVQPVFADAMAHSGTGRKIDFTGIDQNGVRIG